MQTTNVVGKIKTYVSQNINKFGDFLGLKVRGRGRFVCPFCGHRDAGLSYFSSGFFGCYHASCEANEGAGDAIEFATIMLNNLTPTAYKELNAEKKKELFLDTLASLKNWIGDKMPELADSNFNKVREKSKIIVINTDVVNCFEELKQGNLWAIITFNDIVRNIFDEDEKFKYITDTFAQYKNDERQIEVIIYDFIDKLKEINVEAIYKLKPLSCLLKENYYPKNSTNYCKRIIKNCIKPARWSRFTNDSIEKFKLFDFDFTNDDFEYRPIAIFQNYHFYSLIDENNRLVGFQGRLKNEDELTERQAKFVREHEISKCLNPADFEREKFIYNLNTAKDFKKFVVIHEGPADVIAAHSYGITAISFLGKSMSECQFEMLKSHFKKDVPIFVALDNDEGGIKGAKTMSTILKNYYEKVFVVSFTGFNDPSEATKDQYINSLIYQSKRV